MILRGSIYTIEDKKIFTFGGAEPHDKECRIENISWWDEELPNENEMKFTRNNLKGHNNKVDFITTYSSPTSVEVQIKPQYKPNSLTDFLEDIKNTASYEKWHFLHYHNDFAVDEEHICKFCGITRIN